MEATRPVQVARRSTRLAEATRESTQDCTGCGTTISPVDQFYGEDGVRCPACHLEADEVSVPRADLLAIGAAIFGPQALSAMAYAVVMTWIQGGIFERSTGPTMLVLVALLGGLSLALLRLGSVQLRDAWTGRIAFIQTRIERLQQGLLGAWTFGHASLTLGLMLYLAWLVVEL